MRAFKIKFFAIIFMVLSLTACPILSVDADPKPPTEKDISEKAPASLDFEMVEYHWAYLSGGSHIKITGTVKNNSSKDYQGVILEAVLHDEKGKAVAQGSSYVVPTYLKAGAEGTFEVVAMPTRTKGIKHTTLVYNCRPSQR